MAALSGSQRLHDAPISRVVSSGSRFRDGDTLLARITPCLENGKTAQVSGLGTGQIGWGSTEFIVLRERVGKSDNRFVYYLARSPEFREFAIRQMIGSSGRQRVQLDALAEFKVLLPPLAEQRAIAAVLGALDDKIESNRRCRDIIWQLLRAEWDQLAETSPVSVLGEVLGLAYGKSLPAQTRVHGPVPVYGSSGITGSHNQALVNGPAVIVGRKGSIGEVHWSSCSVYPIDTTFYVTTKNEYPLLACYFALQGAGLQSMNSDSAIPGLNRDRVLQVAVQLPTRKEAMDWVSSCAPLLLKVDALDEETSTMEALRNALLPELLSGRVRVLNAVEQGVSS
jgi:type I restriction enzyme S subunit